MSDEELVGAPLEAPEVAVEQHEAEVSEEIQEAEAPEQEAPEEDVPARRSRHKKRAEKMRRLQEDADRLSAEVQAKDERFAAAKQAGSSDLRPVEDGFTTHEEYLVALGAWHARKGLDERSTKDAESEANSARQALEQVQAARQREVQHGWSEQALEAKTRYSDFDQVAYTAPISDDVAGIIMEMDRGADVAYHLGMNPTQADEISRLPPVSAALALGRIEASLSVPKPRKITQAPDPIATVRPKAGVSKSPDEMTADEYAKWRDAGGTFNI